MLYMAKQKYNVNLTNQYIYGICNIWMYNANVTHNEENDLKEITFLFFGKVHLVAR